MQERTNVATQAAVGKILSEPELLKQYYKNPQKVVTANLSEFGLSGDDLAMATSIARRQIEETDRVFPGLTRDEAKELLLGSLGAPRASFAVFTWLNVILFVTGLVLIATAAIFGLVTEEETLTAMFGGGGLAALVPLFITNPLRRIANAASDQSQIRSVVFGFWVQLANWRTEVLEPNKELDEAVVRKVNEDVRKAMEHAVKTLQRYAENKEVDGSDQLAELTKRIEALEKAAKATP